MTHLNSSDNRSRLWGIAAAIICSAILIVQQLSFIVDRLRSIDSEIYQTRIELKGNKKGLGQ